MHKNAMEKTLAQLRLSATIERSGLSDAELAVVLGVNQSTVSRLKNGLIQKVSKHQTKLEAKLGPHSGERNDELWELLAMAKLSPALREALVALQRLMHENA